MDKDGRVAGGGYYRVEIIAQLFGLSVRRIQQLTQEGVLRTSETSDGRRYDLVPTIQAYVQYLSDKAYGKSQSDNESKLKEQKMKAEIALKESQGELHRLKTEIAVGNYISMEDVTLDYSRFFTVFKKFAVSMPSRLIGFVSGYIDPVQVRHLEKEMHREVINMLRSFVVAGVTELPAKKNVKV